MAWYSSSSAVSDRSSIISISDRMAASDTDDGRASFEQHVDTRKYLFPQDTHDQPQEQQRPLYQPDHQQYQHLLARQETPVPALRLRSATLLPDLQFPTPSDASDSSYTSDSDNVNPSSYSPQPVAAAPVSRPASIFSLSRLSFTSQLAELTSIKLPDAVSLSNRISSMPTSAAAASALSDSAEQIQLWIRNALKVLRGLDADDDVEWAAAAGREGLIDVDKAIGRFERVIKLYIFSVEELQMRPDISALPSTDLMRNVAEMDAVMKKWQEIKTGLDGIKEQVEIAMSWEELWNDVLGVAIGQELDELAGLVFQMEEKRHLSVVVVAADPTDARSPMDLDELKTIVEETPVLNNSNAISFSSRHSLSLSPSFSPAQPLSSTHPLGNMEDALIGLFARMQPLRASLDFLPMRLSAFHCRGNSTFPSACSSLESRRDLLEAQWKKLEADAEALRRELGEDRWLLVFRNAGRQALKMCESVSRTVEKLRISIRSGEQQTDAPTVARKIESYEAKKTHYAPAIERVLAIVDKGVSDRLTLNGEILGLQSDMKRRWSALQADIRDMDSTLLDMNVNTRNQQLRDSISTILSSEQSLASSLIDTPRSSAASSVSGIGSHHNNATPRQTSNRFFKSSIPRRLSSNHKKTSGALHSSPLAQPLRPISPTLTPVQFLRQFKPPPDKPRWNSSTITIESESGHKVARMSISMPPHHPQSASPRRTVTPSSAPSRIPAPSPVRPPYNESPSTRAKSPATPASTPHLPTPAGSPLAFRSRSSLGHVTYSGNGRSTPISHQPQFRSVTTPSLTKRNDLLAPNENDQTRGASPRRIARAPSALAVPSGRKSALPSDRGGTRSRSSGRFDDQNAKPRWR